MDGGLEAAHMLHRHVLSVSRLQVFVEDAKDLVVDDLELADSVHHLLQGLRNSRGRVVFC